MTPQEAWLTAAQWGSYPGDSVELIPMFYGEGHDRESYSDDQDRETYSAEDLT